MAEEKNNEIVHVATEVDDIDQIDDQAIVELMTGQTIQDYVYSFRQGGRVVEGLTLAGINEAANRRGGIQVDELNYEEQDNSWIATVKAVDTITGNSRWGAYEQPKMNGSRPDPYAFTKAVHKAQRNAIKQLLPVPVIREVLNYYLHRKAGGTNPRQLPQPQKANDNITNAQKAAFAIANKLAEPLKKKGIEKEGLWTYIKRKYNVESRNDMTEQQWTQLSAELKAAETASNLFDELCKRIQQLTAATEESEVPTVKETEDTETEYKTETKDKEADKAPF